MTSDPPSLFVAASGAPELETALTQLAGRLKGRQQHGVLALVYATEGYPARELAQGLQTLLAPTPWIGMIVQGLLIDDQPLETGIGLALFCGGLRVGLSEPLPAGLPDALAGQAAVRSALEQLGPTAGDPSLIMLCVPGLGSAGEMLRGAVQEAGSGPAWIGGGSGTPAQPGLLMARGRVLEQQVLIAALDWPGRSALAQGWTPLGGTAMVTRSRGEQVQTLDYAPALQVYQRLAELDGFRAAPGHFFEFASRHPLAIPLVSGQYLIRSALSHDAHGTLHCGAELPENCLVQLMSGHPGTLIEAAGAAAASLRAQGPLAGTLAFAGHGRQLALGPRGVDELSACQRKLGASPLFGCVCLGQIASLSGGVPQYHNQNLALLGLPAV